MRTLNRLKESRRIWPAFVPALVVVLAAAGAAGIAVERGNATTADKAV
jgi:hypothetical protein